MVRRQGPVRRCGASATSSTGRPYGAAAAACKRLALGDKHPDIVRALADLATYTGNVKQTVRQLKHDYNLWLADARK